MSSSAATVAAPAARCGARLAPKASGKTSRPRARAFARDEPVRRRATFRGASFRLRAADADDAPAEKTSTTPQKTSSDKTYRPPERDTGIAREADIGIDFEAEEKNEVDADGNTYFLKTGMDRGDAGYRCRWTVQGRSAKRRHVGVPRDALGEDRRERI